MAEKIFLSSLVFCFIIYFVQDAILFEAHRKAVKIWMALKMSRSKVWAVILKFPNHWFICPFCLALVLSLSFLRDFREICGTTVLTALLYRYTFK